MKALVLHEIGGPEKLHLEAIDKPQPAPGEVRIAIRYAALNRRDVWLTLGKYPRIKFPSIGGSDGAGVIDAVGEGIDDTFVGQEVILYPAREWGDDPKCGGPNFRVLGMPDQGTFAEYICAPQSDCVAKPPHLDWPQAATIPLGGLTAWRAVVTMGEISAGQNCLVTGIGGGVATFALLWARHHGAKVWVTSSSPEKLAAAKALGAEGGVDYRSPDWGKQLREMSGGIDLVIDSAGGPVVNQALNTLNNGGRFVFFGATLGVPEEGLELPKLFFKQIRIQGTTMGMPSEFKAMVEFLNEKQLVPAVDRVFPFDDAVAAHQRMHACEQMGKIVLQIA